MSINFYKNLCLVITFCFSLNVVLKAQKVEFFETNLTGAAHAAIQLPDSSYILVGETSEAFFGNRDGVILKTTKDGTFVWQKNCGTDLSSPSQAFTNETFKSVASVANGFLIAGEKHGFDIQEDRITIVKTNNTGDNVFIKDYSFPSASDSLFSIKTIGMQKIPQTTDFLVLCSYTNTSAPAPANGISVERSIKGMLLMRINDVGDSLWTKRLNLFSDVSGKFETPLNFSIPSTNELLICGYYNDYAVSSNISLNKDGFIAKLTVSGNLVWRRGYTESSFLREVIPAIDGGYIAVGADQYLNVPPQTSDGDANLLLIKTNDLGGLSWSRNYEIFEGPTAGYNIKNRNNNKYIITGTFVSLWDENQEYLYMETNPNGDIVDSLMIRHPNDFESIPEYMFETLDGAYSIAGMDGPYDDIWQGSYSLAKISSRVEPLALCQVTVDSLSQFNEVIWEKPITSLLSGFVIYREITTNNYQEVGFRPYDSLSIFIDSTANPNVTSYRYKIAARDLMGNESEKSLYHSTIHMQDLGFGNFQWTQYEIEGTPQPLPVTFYNIFRDDNSVSGYNLLFSLSGSSSTFTDPNFINFPDATYRIYVNWDIACNPTRTVINTTRSNIKRYVQGILDTTGIEDLKSGFKVYPNPTGNLLYLEMKDVSKYLQIELIGLDGRSIQCPISLISSQNDYSVRYSLDLSNLMTGVYFIRVKDTMRSRVLRIIKD
jgi:hypothetical protein